MTAQLAAMRARALGYKNRKEIIGRVVEFGNERERQSIMTVLNIRQLPSGSRSIGVRDNTPDRAEPHDVSFPVVALPKPKNADAVELLRLYSSIDEATRNRSHPIVQLVSAGIGRGNVEVSYNLAWIAANLLDKRILFVDASKDASKPQTMLAHVPMPKSALSDIVLGNATPEQAIATEANVCLFVATLQPERTHGDAVLAAKEIKTLLDELRGSFDMIIVAPTPTLEQPLAAILKTLVDGSVLVVESGKSSSRHVAKCVALLTGANSPIIGAVMWRQRNYIPRWLRRLF